MVSAFQMKSTAVPVVQVGRQRQRSPSSSSSSLFQGMAEEEEKKVKTKSRTILSTDERTIPATSVSLPSKLRLLPSSFRATSLLSAIFLSMAVVTTTLPSSPAIAAVLDDNNNNDAVRMLQSLSPTASIGTSVRTNVVKGAKLIDALDLKWERFSDSLRDKKQCDPNTNRRLFDNGYRSDGTQRGNPVLGSLCEEYAVPLKNIDTTTIHRVLDEAFDNAAYEIFQELSSSSSSVNWDRSSLKDSIDQTRKRLEPAFTRSTSATTTTTPNDEASATSSIEEAKKRQRYNLEVYTRVIGYAEAVTKSSLSSSVSSVVSSTSDAGRKLDLLWGRNLLNSLAGSDDKSFEFRTPFPLPDDLPYDGAKLKNALGSVEVALDALQNGGLIGHWEISIPYDDFGEVVTIAIDDDVGLSAQILAQEAQQNTAAGAASGTATTASNSNTKNKKGRSNGSIYSTGSPVVAMIRTAIEERAQIPYGALDVFYIDPSTTKNELYNPTQLLISIRNVGEEP